MLAANWKFAPLSGRFRLAVGIVGKLRRSRSKPPWPLFVALLSLLQAVDAQAGRPLVIDDAPPVAPGQLEIEVGLSHSRLGGAAANRLGR